MKLEIDTDKKVIRVAQSVLLKDLIDGLKSMLDDWEEYTIETTTIVNNSYPILEPYRSPRKDWWQQPTITW